MVDAQRLARAILNSRNVSRAPKGEEVAMIQVALSHDPAPQVLSDLLDILGDSNQFDFSVDFGLVGQLVQAAETAGDETLEQFTHRWAP